MAKLKLENIVLRQKLHAHPSRGRFCPIDGEDLVVEVVVEEFICDICRNLVDEDDKFCQNCGEPLGAPVRTEHWHKGDKITDAEFKKRSK